MFYLSQLMRWVAFGFGAGQMPWAPGTAGTLMAWVIYWLFFQQLDDIWVAVVIGLSWVLGVWLCQRVSQSLGGGDLPGIVWDEMAAFWFILFMLPNHNVILQFAAFVLFRLFDALKPGPIAWADAHIHGGLGIMLDDLLAAFATLWLMAAFWLLLSNTHAMAWLS